MDPTLAREIEALHPVTFAWALALCAWNRAEAEDVLQTAYLKVWDGRARFEGRAAVKTWWFAVIRKTAQDRRRRAFVLTLGLERLWARRAERPASEDTASGAQVRKAMAELAPRQREVLDLVFFHDLTVEDAAQVMGVSVGSARVHYDRGKRRLKERLT